MATLVFGATGQIGRALKLELGDDGLFLNRLDADLAQPEAIHAALEKHFPSAVINAAAFTQVDKAEEVEGLATAINGEAPGAMASWCAANGVPFIHYSTEYVFSGEGELPQKEMDPTSPLSAYGRSKRVGEEAVKAAGGNYLIFRTSWVYDAEGKNFLNTMLRLGREQQHLKVVSDQIGAPSYASDIAKATLAALQLALGKSSFPSGIYHMCNSDTTSWHGFACAIFDEAYKRSTEMVVRDVRAISTSEYPTPAVRPLNSRLDCSKLQSTFGIALPSWREGLMACMDVIYGPAKHTD